MSVLVTTQKECLFLLGIGVFLIMFVEKCMMPRVWTLIAISLMVLLFPAAGWTACTDPAQPEVNWRRCYHDGRHMPDVDLRNAMLRDATFQRSDLSDSDLSGIDGYRAKFVSAILSGVQFKGARLIEADFTRAILMGANFEGADLRFAKLVNTDLREVNLTRARLRHADLRNARLDGATWIDGIKICAQGSIGQCN